MRLWLCISVLFCFCTAYCWAEKAPAPKTITFELGASKTREVLAAFFLAADEHCVVDPSVQDAPIRPLCFKDVPFDTALKLLSRQLNVTFALKDGSYTAMPITEPAAKVGSQPSNPKPELANAEPKVPVAGMSKQQVLAILGQPTSSQGEVIGYETWFYPNWIISFQKARVAAVEPPVNTRMKFVANNKPIPYIEFIKRAQEAEADAKAARQKQNAAAASAIRNRSRIIVLSGDASDIWRMAQYGQDPNTVFVQMPPK